MTISHLVILTKDGSRTSRSLDGNLVCIAVISKEQHGRISPLVPRSQVSEKMQMFAYFRASSLFDHIPFESDGPNHTTNASSVAIVDTVLV